MLNNEYKTAVLLTYFSKSGQLFFGPSNVTRKMRTSYNCTCNCTCEVDNGVSWEEAFFTDNRDLISWNQIMEIDPTGEKGIVIKIWSENTQIARLPCPLPFMNYRQCADWLREQITMNYIELIELY